MPILDVYVVGPLTGPNTFGASPAELVQRLCDRAGQTLDARPGGTWVRVHEVPADHYAESGGAPTGVAPVFVHVLMRALPVPRTRRELARALAETVAHALDRPADNVHVRFEPSGAGRMAFGGHLVPGPARERASSAAKWETSVGYSRAVRVGDLVWVTGSAALDREGAPVGMGDAYAQAKQCLAVVATALDRVGASMDDVVRTRIFVVDIARDAGAVGRAHREIFGDIRPATTMVEVRRLIADWMLVEIEADACLGAGAPETTAGKPLGTTNAGGEEAS